MISKEVLQKLFYVDKIFSEIPSKEKEKWSKEKIKSFLEENKNKVASMSLADIELKLTSNDLCFFNQYKNKYCKFIRIPVTNLCGDKLHGKAGIFLTDYKFKNKETENRFNSLNNSSNFKIILSQLPIVVRKNDKNQFEVLMGNHRALVLINRGKVDINALEISENIEKSSCKDLNFDCSEYKHEV